MSRRQELGGTLRAKKEQNEHEMPLLAPWTSYKAFEPSFSDDLNRYESHVHSKNVLLTKLVHSQLAEHVEDQVLDKLLELQERLQKLQAQRENSGALPIATLDTLLQTRLIVEAKRKVIPDQIADNVRSPCFILHGLTSTDAHSS
ncbi:unnamed protein product [Phytophthora lilii]|uniref:Unnamed protein product n=1 Tax=Phytophthora lilii TaxID=2077276 RepID=A0A9W6WQ12_9STRA|nr:unnamed protein product [Phytophthora lilii]